MLQSKWLRCFSHTRMEAVRRDPEKCTVNPTTWSLTVVNDSVSYVFAVSTSNLQWKLCWWWWGGGGSVCRYWQFTFLLKKLIGIDHVHFKRD